MDAVAPAAGQRNTIEIFINALEKAFRSSRVYDYASGQATFDSILQNVLGALERCFLEGDILEIDVKPYEMLHEKKVVYQNKEKKTSLSFALYQDGIRLLVFRQGMEKSELRELIQLLSTDFSKSEMMDEDLYCIFTERALPHFQVIGADAIEEAVQKNPQLKSEMVAFSDRVKAKTMPVTVNQPRRLRSEDLRVLEEFRLNPAQFTRSDEEIQKVVEGITGAREGGQKERETVERLLLMGFHFLVHEKDDKEQLQVGRDLVTKTALVVLEANWFDLFEAVIRKVQQLQRDRMDRSGEYQKILDGVFHVDQLNLFSRLMALPNMESQVVKILSTGPASSVRLMILLCGAFPTLTKHFHDPILKQISSHMSWILEEIQKNPQGEAWEQLVNVMATRPTLHFQKVLEVLLDKSGPTVRLKVLKQLAQIGGPEVLKIFQTLLRSEDPKDRMQVYDLLSSCPGKGSLKIIRDHLDSPEFQSCAVDEKEHAYATIAKMGGQLSLPYFEALWNAPGSGLFRKKSESERRLILIKALGRGDQTLVDTLISKVPPDTISEDVKAWLSRRKR